MIEDYDLSSIEGRKDAAHAGIENREIFEEAKEMLKGSSRMKRQQAASVFCFLCKENIDVAKEYADDIADAMNRPEDQTRWNTLNSLDLLGKAGLHFDEDVFEAAEDAMYDEDSGVLRQSAFQFFCGYASASPEHSDKVWPLIDEAIQCYHGNQEFGAMLTSLVELAQSKNISDKALQGLATRMKFDAKSAKGTLGMRSQQIVDALEARGLDFLEDDSKKSAKPDSDEEELD